MTIRLDNLPTEQIRLIGSFLPCAYALQFHFCSCRIRQACDDWLIWREVLKNDPAYEYEIPTHTQTTKDIYKIVAIANGTSSRPGMQGTGPPRWLPRHMAYHPQAVSTIDLTTLFRLSEPPSGQTVSPIRIGRIGRHIASNPLIHHDIDTLRIAHASSHCLAVRLLSSEVVDASTFRFWNPKNGLLDNLDWFKISFPERLPIDVFEKLIVQLHTSANRMIAFIAAELRYALVNGFFDQAQVVGLAPLPTVSGISIESSSTVESCPNVPMLETFIPSHVPCTGRLEWFTKSSWTGYFSRTGEQLAEFARVFTMYGDHFDGIGAKRVDAKDYNQRYPRIPCLIESVVQFRYISDVRSPDFSLQSNYFYSQSGIHSLQLKVNTQIGTFHMSHLEDKHHRGTSYGVITPFGLITACVPGSLWLWLWKVDWCT